MTFEEKWDHVARRLFVFFTREGVFNFSLLLLSPLEQARDRYLPVSSGEPAPEGKARNGDLLISRESLPQRGKQGMEIYLFYRESLPQT